MIFEVFLHTLFFCIHCIHLGKEHDLYEVTCSKTGVTCFTSRNRSLINETINQLLTVIIYGTDFRAYEAPLPRKSNHLVNSC